MQRNTGASQFSYIRATQHHTHLVALFQKITTAVLTQAILTRTRVQCRPLNGMSLSGMRLTWDRWCCTELWLSKLDTNSCQTSIKTDILLLCSRSPHLGFTGPTRNRHIGSERTNQGWEVKRTNADLLNKYRRSTTETIMHPTDQNILPNCPHFGIDFLHL